MLNYLKGNIVLIQYPFSDLAGSKVRPAIVVNAPHSSQDLMIVPLTSRTHLLMAGEFVLNDWQPAGLNVPSAVKRGAYTIHASLCLKRIGQITSADQALLRASLKHWLDL